MTTTVTNRLAAHLPPATTPLPVPATAADREVAFADAVAAAVGFFAARVRGADPHAAERAALVLIDLEKTRLRHGRKIAGTAGDPEDFDSPLARDRYPDDEEFEGEEDNEAEDDIADEEEPAANGPVGPDGEAWAPEPRRAFELAAAHYAATRRQNEIDLSEGRAEADIRVFDFDGPPPDEPRRGLTGQRPAEG